MIQPLTFTFLAPKDCPLLHQWLQLPHVRAFWDDGLRTEDQVRQYYFKDNGVLRFLFFIKEEAAGYIQTYRIASQDPYGAYTLPAKENWGMDFFRTLD